MYKALNHFLADAWASGHMWQRWGSPQAPKTKEDQLRLVAVARDREAPPVHREPGELHHRRLRLAVDAGLGAGLGSEEWPFISARSEVVLEPGMVMAFECPWYIDGLGGMIIENQVLITEGGHETMNALPLDLVRVPA